MAPTRLDDERNSSLGISYLPHAGKILPTGCPLVQTDSLADRDQMPASGGIFVPGGGKIFPRDMGCQRPAQADANATLQQPYVLDFWLCNALGRQHSLRDCPRRKRLFRC